MATNKVLFDSCLFPKAIPQIDYNTMYSGCCCTLICRLTNTDTKTRIISSIVGTWDTGSFTFTLSPLTFPFFISAGGFIDIEFQVCAFSGVTNVELEIEITFVGDPKESTYFPFELCDPSTMVSPTTLNFGTLAVGTSSSPQTITVTNCQNVCGANFYFNSGTAGGGFVATPSSLSLLPSATGTMDIVWTPTLPNIDLSGTHIEIEVCGVESDVNVFGESEEGECPCLCCNGIEIQTEDGRCVDNYISVCDVENIYENSAIGEKKSVVFDFSYNYGIGNNFEVYFNPIIWAVNCNYSTKYGGPINSPPPFGYYIELFISMIGGGWQTMSLFNTSFNTPNQKNWIVELRLLTATTFQIRMTMFLISDLEDWISAAVFNNAPKWRRNHVFAPVPPLSGPLTNSFPSVYNSNRKLCSLFWVHDPNRINETTGNDFECYEIKSINWTSRFFNKGLYDGPSEFLNPLFVFERSGNPVSNLSTVQKTEVKFYINIPSTFGTLACIYFNLFDESTTDNTVDFLTNYNNSRSEITTIPSNGILDNLLESPSAVTPLGGDDYEITAFVGTGLNASHQYRIFAVVYSTDGLVNSFISDPLTVTNIPTPDCENCYIGTLSNWDQIFRNTESDCLRPVAKERIRHNVLFFQGTIKTCFEEIVDWLDYVVSLTLNVYRRATDFPVSGKTTFFMIEQQTSNRVVGYPSNWNNTGTLIVADSGGNIVSEFTRRVGFESTPFAGSNVYVADTATYMNRTPAGILGTPYVTTLGITNDWRGEQIIYEYVLKMDFSSIYSTPYEINYIKAFQILAIENEPDNSGFQVVITDFVFECLSGGVWTEIVGSFCPNDCDSLRARYTANQNGNFAFFANPTPSGNVSNVKESEDDAFFLPQQLNVVSLDLTYSGSGPYEAVAILDPSSLTAGLSYELCGYWSEPKE
jgi:hypothetical protein